MKKSITLAISVLSLTALTVMFLPQMESSSRSLVELDKRIMAKSAQKAGPTVMMSERKRKVKGLVKQDEPNKFAEWQTGIRTRDGEERPEYDFNYRVKALLKAHNVKNIAEFSKKQSLNKAGNGEVFVERGPGNVSGRTRALVVDPDDPNFDTWYAGSVGGGVWKTIDAGQNWTQLTPDIGNLATSTIAQSASNPDVIYVGTGEGFYNVDQIDGNGIWKTTDRGVTWQQLASTINENFQNIMRLIVDPANENIVLAATLPITDYLGSSSITPGIYKSYDGGQNWKKVYSASIYDFWKNNIQHLISDPLNFNNLYATVNGVGIIKSKDAGETWSTIPVSGSYGRLEIAIAPSNTSRLYMSAEGGSSGTGSTLYISRDSGESWTAASEKDGGDFNWLGGQAWYDNTINVNPFDENDVFVGGIDIWRISVNTDNTIITTRIIDSHGNSKGVHADQHNIVMIKTDEANSSFRMINCNDGGVVYSDDKGATFNTTENGFNTSQFYGIDKKNGENRYIGGMQDNSTYVSPEDPNSSTAWTFQWGGDGYEAVWKYDDGSKVLISSQFNRIGRSTNGAVSFSSGTNGLKDTGSDKAPFFTKLAQSKQYPGLVFALGISGVWRTEDFAANWSLTKMPNGFSGTGTFSRINISLVNPQIVWTAQTVSDNLGAFVSQDGGFEFEETNSLPFPMGRITGLATHPTQRNTAYLLYSFAAGPKIVRTTDLGQTWEDISGFGDGNSSTIGFPDVAVYSLVVMPYDTTIIWAGTGIGLFESTDNGASWHTTNYGLPNVAIYQMVVVNDQVVVATHGRGIWSITKAELAGYEPPPAPLAPKLNTVAYDGSSLALGTEFRDVYDSTQVRVDGVTISTVFNDTPFDSTLHVGFTADSTSEIEVRLYSYQNGDFFVSKKIYLEVFSFQNPLNSYLTDFEDDPSQDFLGTDFEIKRLFGFLNKAIHSPHDYENETTYLYTLKKPIVVSAVDARMSYADVAIVEPGDPGTVFGDEKFWDYVVVEGSKNGNDWLPLADGYDARYDPKWEAAWTQSTLYRKLFKTHELDISDTFNAGDTILIRFKLFTDELETGWGWVIDSLQIQDLTLALGDLNFTVNKFSLQQNYPNPFNPTTTIRFSLDKSASVSLRVYDITGKLVKTLYNDKKLKAGVAHKVVWNGKNNLGNSVASGTFYYKLKAGEKVSVKKMILLR